MARPTRSKTTKEIKEPNRGFKHAKYEDINWSALDPLLELKPTAHTCAGILGCSHDLIEIHIRRLYNMTFGEYRELRMSPTKVKLVTKAIDMALSGNVTMLIFCLKNLCDWTDQVTAISEDNKVITLNYKINDLKKHKTRVDDCK